MWEKLKKLQARREELAAEVQKMADNTETDSWQENWDKLNTDYDANYTELEAVQKECEAEQTQKARVAARVAMMGEHAASGASLQNLGRDNARIGDANAIIADRVGTAGTPQGNPSALFAMALQGWFAMPHEDAATLVTDEHRAAAKACGINLNSREIRIQVGDTNQARAMQASVQFQSPAIARQQNVLQTVTGASGGFLIGESFVNNLELAMSAFGGVLQVAEIIRTPTANPMRWPTGDDTSNTGEQVSESKDVDGSVDPTFAQQVWTQDSSGRLV